MDGRCFRCASLDGDADFLDISSCDQKTTRFILLMGKD